MSQSEQSSGKTILVLGTNAGQADLIRHMKTLGWTVISCAHLAGGPGEAHSDAFHLIDVRDVDAVTALAENVGADLVYSISSDLALTVAVAVSERLGLPHFFSSDMVDLLNQKTRLRGHLNQAGLGAVDYIEADKATDISGWTAFPCMVKPTDSQGQRGVQKIYSADELAPAVEAALAASLDSGKAIIEEFLDGVEVSCNVLVKGGEIVFDVLSERLVHGGELTGVPIGHLVPCINVSAEDQARSIKLVHDIVALLGVETGCLYFQMIITAQGPKIVEIAPRLDGCHMWRLIELATGESFLKGTIECLLDEAYSGKRPHVVDGENYELIFQQMPPGSAFDPAEFLAPNDAHYHEYRYAPGADVLAVNGKLEVVGYYVRQMSASDVEAREGGAS